MMGRRKRDGNDSSPKNKLVQDSEGNEKKWIPNSRPQQNKDRVSQGTQ
jgi:hypothetical protein